MSSNIYYNIHSHDNNHLKVPEHILNDERLACVYHHCKYSRSYIRLFDRSCNFINYDYRVILVNPSDEDLTYLTLLGVGYTETFDNK